MKSLVAAFLMAFAFVISARAESADLWTSDYEAALVKAKEENKLVLLDFTGSDWCGWCIRLKKEVFSQPGFKEYASKHFILVEVDFPRSKKLPAALVAQNDKLQEKFNIEGYPTIVVVDAAGSEVGRTGYVKGGPVAFNAELAAAAKLN